MACHWIAAAASGGQQSLNVLGGVLEPCSYDPITGFFSRWLLCDRTAGSWQPHGLRRDDGGISGVSKQRGNDLSTPMPEYGFAGLKPGDRWCLCAPRWAEAFLAGAAPRVLLRATEIGALEHCALKDLKKHALDLV